jgi:hypothetical protein
MSNKEDFIMLSVFKDIKVSVMLENIENDPELSKLKTHAEIPTKNLSSYRRFV